MDEELLAKLQNQILTGQAAQIGMDSDSCSVEATELDQRSKYTFGLRGPAPAPRPQPPDDASPVVGGGAGPRADQFIPNRALASDGGACGEEEENPCVDLDQAVHLTNRTQRFHKRRRLAAQAQTQAQRPPSVVAAGAGPPAGGADDDDLCSSCSEDEVVLAYEREQPAEAGPTEDALLSDSRSSAAGAARGGGPRPTGELPGWMHCFRCRYGDKRYDAANAPKVQELWRLMAEGVGHTNTVALAKTLHLFFKHEIYLPMRRAGKRIPMWRTRHVLEHLRYHEQEPHLWIAESILQAKKLQYLAAQSVFQVGKDGKVRPQAAMFKVWEAMTKTLVSLYGAKPREMNFCDEGAGMSLKARPTAQHGLQVSYQVKTTFLQR